MDLQTLINSLLASLMASNSHSMSYAHTRAAGRKLTLLRPVLSSQEK